MALSSFTVTIITKSDSPFNIIENAPIEIRERLANGSSGNLSLIFSDSAGLNPITQVGFAANSLGQATFFAAAADYNAVYDNNGTPVTIAVDVGVTGGILDERFDRLNPATLAIWQDDTSAQLDDVVDVKERSTGSGGGFTADVVTGQTPNPFDIIAHGTLPLQLQIRSNGIVNLRKYGVTSGSDASLAMQRASDLFSTKKIILDLPVTWSTQYTLRSNIEIDGVKSGVITIDTALAAQGILGTSVSNFKIHGLTMLRDTSLPVSAGIKRHIQLNGCSKFVIEDVDMNQSHNIAVEIDSCSEFTVTKFRANNNFVYGLELRNGCTDFTLSKLTLKDNGFLGANPGAPTGRGLNIWQCQRGTVNGVVSKGSSEYGIRLYTQSDDTLPSRQITLTNLIIEDSGSIDFFMFNESGMLSDINITNLNIRTKGVGKVACALEGTNITLTGGTFVSDDPQQNDAFAFSNLTGCTVSNIITVDFADFSSYGITIPPVNLKIHHCEGNGLQRIAPIMNGTGHAINDCDFRFHSSASVAAIGLTSVAAEISRNKFDGAFQCITMSNTPSKITGNTSINTINVPVRMFGTSLTGMTIEGNNWDLPTNPAEFGRISEFGIHGDREHAVIITNAIPSIFTYPERAIAYTYVSSALPGFIGWTQVTAGTPGILNGGATTGGITTGTPDLVVSDATGLFEGAYITIVGVSGTKRITLIVGTAVTLDSNADATVSGAAVAYFNGVWKTFGVVTP